MLSVPRTTSARSRNLKERRLHPRSPMERDIVCYINGARFDAQSRNMGVGGMFLSFSGSKVIAEGSVVGILSKPRSGVATPLFVVGRVVWMKPPPFPGVGLQWVKVVTRGPAAELSRFMGEVFGLKDVHVRRETPSSGGEAVNACYFEPDGAGQIELDKTFASPDKPGAISEMTEQKGKTAATALDGRITLDGKEVDARVTQLGMTGLTVETQTAPMDTQDPVKVKMGILSKEGTTRVVCRCRIVAAVQTLRAIRLELAIEKLDEGRHSGILKRYVRWLHFKSLSGD